jgi:hypothetical protein
VISAGQLCATGDRARKRRQQGAFGSAPYFLLQRTNDFPKISPL